MTRADKEMLLRDLSARLLYGVMVSYKDLMCPLFSVTPTQHFQITLDSKHGGLVYISLDVDGENPKPYLRPISSMTEEEEEEFCEIEGRCVFPLKYIKLTLSIDELNWFYSKHFNINLPDHLYIKVTEKNNPYKE